MNTTLPLVSMILMSYKQESIVKDAVEGALKQSYGNLEIIISDDNSPDGTFAAIQDALKGYTGPHRVIINQNPRNLGISGNLRHAIGLSSGELIFITAGDDISLPQRVKTVTRHWLALAKKPDLIASYLYDMDEHGVDHGVIDVADLALYKTIDDWTNNHPKIIGAGQAWTRRLFDHFNGIPRGIVAEDMIMTFRAIACGGAVTLKEPLVRYRRGGTTGKRRHLSAGEVIAAFVKKIDNTKIELACMLDDARNNEGSSDTIKYLQNLYEKEVFIEAMLRSPHTKTQKIAIAARSSQPFAFKIRLLAYAVAPALLSPFFAIKRLIKKQDNYTNI